MVLSKIVDISSGTAMLVAGALLVVLGLGHAFMPATSVVGGIVNMLPGIDVTNSFANLPGLFVRLVGVFVALLGLDFFDM